MKFSRKIRKHRLINNLIIFFGANSKLHLLKIFIIFGLAGSLSVILSDPLLKLVSIENFVSNYDEAIQDEERLAVIVGYIADNFMQLDAPSKSRIRKWVESILI